MSEIGRREVLTGAVTLAAATGMAGKAAASAHVAAAGRFVSPAPPAGAAYAFFDDVVRADGSMPLDRAGPKGDR